MVDQGLTTKRDSQPQVSFLNDEVISSLSLSSEEVT